MKRKFYLYAFQAWQGRIFGNNRWRTRLDAYSVMDRSRQRRGGRDS